jgi:hypothetical protein
MITITFDEKGQSVSDVEIESFVKDKFQSKSDIHISNQLTVNGIRAYLIELPIEERPEIKWIFFGKEVFFDKDLRSHDAWKDDRTDIASKFLMKIMIPQKRRTNG